MTTATAQTSDDKLTPAALETIAWGQYRIAGGPITHDAVSYVRIARREEGAPVFWARVDELNAAALPASERGELCTSHGAKAYGRWHADWTGHLGDELAQELDTLEGAVGLVLEIVELETERDAVGDELRQLEDSGADRWEIARVEARWDGLNTRIGTLTRYVKRAGYAA